MMKFIQTYIDNGEVAETLAETLLNERLSASVGIWPAKSRYWWKGEVVRKDREFVVLVRTKESLVEETIKRIKQIHTYELPAIEVFGVEKVNPGIEEWINEVTR